MAARSSTIQSDRMRIYDKRHWKDRTITSILLRQECTDVARVSLTLLRWQASASRWWHNRMEPPSACWVWKNSCQPTPQVIACSVLIRCRHTCNWSGSERKALISKRDHLMYCINEGKLGKHACYFCRQFLTSATLRRRMSCRWYADEVIDSSRTSNAAKPYIWWILSLGGPAFNCGTLSIFSSFSVIKKLWENVRVKYLQSETERP